MKFRRHFSILIFLLAFSISANAQVQKYSFRRIVTVQDHNKILTRKSFIFYDDAGRANETEIQQVGKLRGVNKNYWEHFPNPAILSEPYLTKAPYGFSVTWTNERGILDAQDLPWFADEELSGLMFPISAEAVGPRTIHVRYFDYRLYRSSLVIREVTQ